MKNWDKLVLSTPKGTLFQTSKWLSIFDPQPQLIYSVEGEEILGGLIYTETRKKRLKGINIPPYTPVFSPLWTGELQDHKDLTNYRSFISFLTGHLGKSQVIDFINYADNLDIIPYMWDKYISRPGITYQVRKKDFNIGDVHKSKARYIKKLIKLVEEGELIINTDPDVARIRDMQVEVARRNNFNANIGIIEKLCASEALAGHWTAISIQDKQGQYLAGCIAPHDNYRAYHIVNASTEVSGNSLLNKANFLLTFILAQKTLESGRILDFEGSTLKGVEEFYRQMGGEQVLRFRSTKFNIFGIGDLISRFL